MTQLVRARQVGRTRLIRANGESPLVDPLREILLVATGPTILTSEEFAGPPASWTMCAVARRSP